MCSHYPIYYGVYWSPVCEVDLQAVTVAGEQCWLESLFVRLVCIYVLALQILCDL